jgi:NitT/TauT family transport system substrate-binding protein
MRRRRGFARLLAGALLVVLGPSGATAQPPGAARIRVGVIDGMQLLPMYIVQTRGIAEKYQLQIEQVKAAGPQGLHTILQAGAVQAGFAGWVTIAVLRSQGHKLTNVYSLYGFTNDVMVPTDSPLKSFGDLKGKRVGVFGGPNAASSWLFRLLALKFFGFDPTKESKVHYGAPPLLLGMLEKGELDALMSLDPQIVQMLETGRFRSIGNLGEIWRSRTGQDPMLVAVTVDETWAKQNPAVVKRFVAAIKEAIEYLRAHREVWPELAKSVGIKTEPGAALLHERTVRSFITRWDQTFIDEQYAYAAELVRVVGESAGIPKHLAEGTFDLAYAP